MLIKYFENQNLTIRIKENISSKHYKGQDMIDNTRKKNYTK